MYTILGGNSSAFTPTRLHAPSPEYSAGHKLLTFSAAFRTLTNLRLPTTRMQVEELIPLAEPSNLLQETPVLAHHLQNPN